MHRKIPQRPQIRKPREQQVWDAVCWVKEQPLKRGSYTFKER